MDQNCHLNGRWKQVKYMLLYKHIQPGKINVYIQIE